uniref:Integrase family protein n=1 Tax=Methanococcus maripaludis (strain C6 / ATCC BAA-1332) TaxID=444158 RepID=A9A6F8_METM6
MDINKMLKLKKPEPEPITETKEMNKWVSEFIDAREFDGIKKTTITNDVTRLRVFIDFSTQKLNKELDQLQNVDFIKFFNYLDKEKGIKRNTQKRYFDLLKVFYKINRLSNFDEFKEDSEERKRFKRCEVAHYDFIDRETLTKIIDMIAEGRSQTKVRDVIILRMLWDTGCRASEVVNLTYFDVDMDTGKIKVRNTKGKVERTVGCSKDTLNLLKYYSNHQIYKTPKDHIFKNRKGEAKIEVNWISEVFRKAVRKLKESGDIPNNKKLVVHSLRHGRAVDLLDKGFPIDIVKEYLGHSSLETTLFYAHAKEREKKMLDDIMKSL